jgi:hypothetical protein
LVEVFADEDVVMKLKTMEDVSRQKEEDKKH